MKNNVLILGKLFYAIIFLVIIPVVLWFWAKYTNHIIRYPEIESKYAGWILIISGGLLMLLGMFALKKYGKGLPMNAFPPKEFVKEGVFHLFRHPIYWGFGIFMVGFFILEGSASGLWLVTPVIILCMIALVLGYEKISLKQRFPDKTIITVLDLPKNNNDLLILRERLASLFWVASLLLLSNYLTSLLTLKTPALFDNPLDFYSLLDFHYFPLLVILFIFITPFVIKTKKLLRKWNISVILALSSSLFIALQFPRIGAQYLNPNNPVFLTVPIFLTLISIKALIKQSRQLLFLLIFTGAVLVIIQLTNSRSAILHLITSFFIFLLSAYYIKIWIYLKKTTEKIANSWREWQLGKVRVINHGFYAGFAAFLGIFLSGMLVGDEYAWAILIFVTVVIIFSALWAQIIEGSEKLKRPFGYYGALVGIIFASLIIWAIGFDVWCIIGVISVFMPWVQAIGRFRCLVNGCCHGGKTNNTDVGIRYFHHRSRVSSISDLKGELLHPTPLYSIIWLFLIGFVLLSLWNNNFSSPFIFGLYLILTGIGRFVEEAYRGEVQTPVIKGLRLYQWTAILSVIIGIIMTFIQVDAIVINSVFGWKTVLSATIGGLFTTFAMGVDFPYSDMRFSRLV